jgi:hypothetical protein
LHILSKVSGQHTGASFSIKLYDMFNDYPLLDTVIGVKNRHYQVAEFLFKKYRVNKSLVYYWQWLSSKIQEFMYDRRLRHQLHGS